MEGYTAILQDVDKAIRLIRAADDSAGAGAALAKEFGLTAEQTKGVLNMTLGRLTGMEVGRNSTASPPPPAALTLPRPFPGQKA